MSLDVPESFKAPEDFSAEVSGSGKDVVVAVKGDLDVLTAPLLWESLEEAIEASEGDVTLDLAGTTFIDSMGLGVIIRGHKRLATEAGSLIVRAASDQAQSVFRLTGLDQVLDLRV